MCLLRDAEADPPSDAVLLEYLDIERRIEAQ